jgi:hypothetical protein
MQVSETASLFFLDSRDETAAIPRRAISAHLRPPMYVAPRRTRALVELDLVVAGHPAADLPRARHTHAVPTELRIERIQVGWHPEPSP